ncbi:MAG: 50S ribosomal protein L24 [Candidatus Ryanbacteria bacterium RIFCSPLOWO2_01_FULL_48_26]|uniref:Large ribosomal subunit protein uL24 n=1 Tax=Candidatus Ryanbacteria bacterium RIFCSPLOWO2_01_FULL_48_26 TaxID=1802126 RepID=A0A1G2GVS6_9BACT|nr:MAG: 50S ribosomal protein L24 [Candidatus Ryanbacteria bacterium RIFCSPLOWO2_01_FULL_48_26]
MITFLKIKKGDTVAVLRGKDHGKTGKIVKVYPADGKVMIDGVNERIRHTKPRRQGQKGQRVTISHPIVVSNVQLVCPYCKKRTRVGYRVESDSKVRVCKKCKADLA